MELLRWILRIVLVVVLVAVPVWIYFAFIADEPVFGPEQDVELGRQSAEAIKEDASMPLLSREEYPEAYAHLNRIVSGVVNSKSIRYRDLFPYDNMHIIYDDDVLNAFCTPGGFIYVYSGLIRYLDAEDHLAGVLGHEIAHAEQRHSSLRLQKEYGARKLLEFAVLTSPMTVGDAVSVKIMKDVLTLDYSRDQEAEADSWSVRYLADSRYACDGTAGFFEKLLAQGDGVAIPEFLSDHPDPAARVAAIRSQAKQLGCSTEVRDQTQWRAFQASLPEPKARQE